MFCRVVEEHTFHNYTSIFGAAGKNQHHLYILSNILMFIRHRSSSLLNVLHLLQRPEFDSNGGMYHKTKKNMIIYIYIQIMVVQWLNDLKKFHLNLTKIQSPAVGFPATKRSVARGPDFSKASSKTYCGTCNEAPSAPREISNMRVCL